MVEQDIKIIEEKIGIPASEWAGKCHQIASLIYKKGLVPKDSKVRYGLWWGEISKKCIFSGRPFTHHGWIELPNRRIYDPTRFAFFDEKPYIFIGDLTEEYDMGGNKLLEDNPRPEKKGEIFELTKEQKENLRCFIEDPENGIYLSDCFWLGNMPLDKLDGYAKQIYSTLVKLGHKAVIPFDNYQIIMEDSE